MLWHRYLNAIQKYPLSANIATTAVITLCGDVAAQFIEFSQHEKFSQNLEPEVYHEPSPIHITERIINTNISNENIHSRKARDEASIFHLDFKRIFFVSSFWTCFTPARLVWFRWLDSTFPTASLRPNLNSLAILGKKLTLHLSIFAPLANSLFYGWIIVCYDTLGTKTTVVAHDDQQHSKNDDEHTIWKKWKTKLQCDLIETQKASLSFWGLAHVFNFIFLPAYSRVLYNSILSAFWTTYISMLGHRK